MIDHFDPRPRARIEPLAKLLDVTLRDGGFEVDFDWPEDHFAMVAATAAATGVDIVELGYLGGVPLEHSVEIAGIGAHLTPDHVAAAAHDGVGLAAMIHPSALASPPQLGAFAAAGLTMIRFVYQPRWAAEIAELAARAHAAGLTVSVNIALASRYRPAELLDHAAAIAAASDAEIVYIADTCSAMAPDHVATLVRRMRTRIEAAIGFHAHDFLGLAYANALAAVEAGATYLDCSLLGLGRGAGNLAAEPLLLRHRMRGVGASAGEALLECRTELASTTGRLLRSLLPVVCAVLNLTPVEEQAVREFADREQLDIETAALWLLTQADQLPTVAVADLRARWRRTRWPRRTRVVSR
ncbi:hypothetical protein AB0C65_35825 [Nocardia sp. NPDC048505]|uniref:hypothetical protein n=1 Tax=Nocardia sp. NPDC048505 TaxID=3155756 RepID=UPI0033C4C2D0